MSLNRDSSFLASDASKSAFEEEEEDDGSLIIAQEQNCLPNIPLTSVTHTVTSPIPSVLPPAPRFR